MKFTRRIVTDIKTFRGLEKEWKQLLTEVPSATIFQSWEWQLSWVETFEKELFVITLSDAKELIAILPFFAVSKPFFSILKLIGSPASDYLDFLIKDGYEEQVITFFFDEVVNTNAFIGIVELDSIPETSPNHLFFKNTIRSREFHIKTREKVCPFIQLPNSGDKYLSSLSSSTRYFINRKKRKLQKKFTVTSGFVETQQELEIRMQDFILQHQMRWKTKQRPGAFAKDSFAIFHKKVAKRFFEKGKLRLYYLALDGKSVASYYLFYENNTFYFYLSGFNQEYEKYSVSSVLLSKAIQSAIDLELKEFDLMRGDGAYKFKWTKKKRINKSYFIEKRTVTVFLYSTITSFISFLAGVIKEKVPFSLKSKVRSLLPKAFIKFLDPYFQ